MTKPLLLSIDDEVEQTAFMQDFFEDTHEIHTANDVATALRLIETHNFAVALVDYRLPGGTGFTVFRKLAEKSPDCKRYLLSATDIDHEQRQQEPPYTQLGKGLRPRDLVKHVLSGSTVDI